MSRVNRKSTLPENTYLWLLTVSFLFSLIISLGALRSNNQRMVELRQQVYVADKTGLGVDAAINDLRGHIYSHMNTSLVSGSNGIKPPLQLKYTYDRLLAAEQEKASQAGGSVYIDAQSYCQQQNSTDFSGRNRVPCVQEYVASHNSSTSVNIPASLYQFDFVSPTWSPDLAGWSLVATVIFGVILAGTILIRYLAAKRLDS